VGGGFEKEKSNKDNTKNCQQDLAEEIHQTEDKGNLKKGKGEVWPDRTCEDLKSCRSVRAFKVCVRRKGRERIRGG